LRPLLLIYNVERFGIVNMGNPKHDDALLVIGPANYCNCRVLRNLYKQMPNPKGVIVGGPVAALAAYYTTAPTS
jgi:ech hydrogenase subunit C